MRDAARLTALIKARAQQLGFVACGIATAAPLPETRQIFQDRIAAGLYAGLPWFTSERALRCTDPDRSVAGARSVISLAAAYSNGPAPSGGAVPRGRVARYAWGRDYHRVLERPLKHLCALLDAEAPGSCSRLLVDYGPLAERAYAARAGIGWFGKSTNLLLPGAGSWVLLSEVVTTAVLEPDPPLRKSCGACCRCVSACPTGAITAPNVVDNERCISYQTIENRGSIPRSLRPLIGDWVFGCDLCQEACPVGAGRSTSPLVDLLPRDLEAAAPALLPLLELDEAAFRARFAGRPIMRAKRDGLLRNVCVALGNLGDRGAVPALARALRDTSALVRGHAAWALGRLGGTAARAALEAARGTEADVMVLEEMTAALAALDQTEADHVPA